MIILLPVLIALIGVILYFAATTNAKLAEVGRLMFFCGLLAFLLKDAPLVTLLGR